MNVTDSTENSRWGWLAPPVAALFCLLPLLLLWDRFRTLYWFHDDWDLISEMQSSGTAAWLMQRYGENFAPVFKLLWEAAVVLVGGSYMGMILLLWGTHLANLLLLSELLRRCSFPWKWQSLAVVTLGMPWSNIESLGWAACWISLLNILFFLLAWVLLADSESTGGSRWAVLLAVICALASALTFSRGVFAGALLAFFLIHAARAEGRFCRRHLWIAGCLTAVTAISLLPYAWMLKDYSHFEGLDGDRLRAMASYAAHYALLNPLYQLMPMPHRSVGLKEMLFAGGIKGLIVAGGLIFSRGRQRTLLWTLLLFEATMTALLGPGRYDREILTATSYRYQYPALLCFAPFFAISATKGLELLKRPVREAAFAAVFAGWSGLAGIPWPHYLANWSAWRGTDVRNALASAGPDERFGLPAITAGRARELIRIYNLH